MPAPRTRAVVARSSLAAGVATLLLALVAQCAPPTQQQRPRAIVAPDRSAHLLDRPYPSDELRSPLGGTALTGFPRVGPAIGQLFVSGWLAQAERVARGFPATTPIYFRFESQPVLATRYEGRLFDPVLLLCLDHREAVPVNVRWIADSNGDPYLPSGTLVVTPDETRPLRSGARYVALVSRRVARPAVGWSPPREVAGFDAAVSTVFTVQDHAGELDALRRAADALLDANPALLQPLGGLREVASISFEQGTIAGRATTVETVTFADGGTETTYLRGLAGAAPRTVDLTTGPLAVYQATIHTAAFQDPSGRPWQSPGLGIIFDTARTDGWIEFGPDGAPLRAPIPEPMRVVVQVPRTGSGFAVIDWGHGSGGDAYEPVARTDPANDVAAIRTRLAERGAIVVSGDHPLFGTRFGYMAAGYDNDLLVVNIPNLAAFRANFQQGAIDGHVRRRFAREVLPALLGPSWFVDPARGVGAFGHSIGAQMAGVGAGTYRDGDPAAPGAVLLNGTGGQLTHSVLASDLLQIEGTVGATIFELAGLSPRPGATAAEVLGALLGVPEPAWPNVDRHHPLALPFQLLVDGADPLAMAREHAVPIDVMGGENDSKVAFEGFAWLAAAFRLGALAPCTPATAYDGHFCVFREPAGLEAFARLVDRL